MLYNIRMHWSYILAEEVLKKYPKRKEYVVASGISPSGSVHIGNYREFVTNYYVAKALKAMGKKVRMLFSWDEFDRFRKVPKNFPTDKVNYADYIGRPYVDIPSPKSENGTESSAKYFENEFETALTQLQMDEIPVRMIYQADEYRSGCYGEYIAEAIKKRKQIYDIIMSFKTQDGEEGERDSYYPISIYCESCGKDSTDILGFDEKTNEVEYECKCGNRHKENVMTAGNIKLVWKVDWPMRWLFENVAFEAAGIDHHSEGGSYDVASRISREVWGYEPPCSVCYAWVGIRRPAEKTGDANQKSVTHTDMHSSSGINITPNQLLQVYEPEILRYLYAKYPVGDAFDFGFDETIIRHYQEFDRGYEKWNEYKNGGEGELPEYDRTVYDLCLFASPVPARINFGTLVTVAPLTGFNKELTKKILTKTGITEFGNFDERFGRVKYWLENYMPDRIYKLLQKPNKEFYDTLNAEQKTILAKLKDYLAADRTEKEIQEFLYSVINEDALSKKENIARQQVYFKIFYNMLFGRDDGPRLYLFLAAADKKQYLPLL
jgi:lysyl-tRNA synthetase class 1